MNEGGLVLWVRHAPYSTVHFSEGIRVAAMTSALDVPVTFVFVGDGVRVLTQRQEPYRLGPPVERLLAGIVTESNPARVHAPSLARRGLKRDDLVTSVPWRVVDDHGAAELLLGASRTVPL